MSTVIRMLSHDFNTIRAGIGRVYTLTYDFMQRHPIVTMALGGLGVVSGAFFWRRKQFMSQ